MDHARDFQLPILKDLAKSAQLDELPEALQRVEQLDAGFRNPLRADHMRKLEELDFFKKSRRSPATEAALTPLKDGVSV